MAELRKSNRLTRQLPTNKRLKPLSKLPILLGSFFFIFTNPVIVSLAIAESVLTNPSQISEEEFYQKALLLNKEGKGKESMQILQGLMKDHPKIERYKFDYLAVASASGFDQEVSTYVDGEFEKNAPSYVQDALFKSALAVNDVNRMELVGNAIISSRGLQLNVGNKLVFAALQRGDSVKALDLSRKLIDKFPNELASWDTRAYVLRELGRPTEALLVYEGMADRFPEDINARKAIVIILLGLGAAHQADRLAAQYHVTISDSERIRIMNGEGVSDLRWATFDPDTPSERYLHANRSIGELDKALSFALSNRGADDELNRIRADLIVAYQERRLWSQSIEQYEFMLSSGATVPSYAKLSAAFSYGAMRKYVVAENILHELAMENPDSFEISMGWFYSLVDMDHFGKAQGVIDDLIARYSKADRQMGSKAAAYTDALIARAMLEAYQDRLDLAAARLNDILVLAPASDSALASLAAVELWRGLPRSSQEYSQIVLGEYPGNVNSKIAYANARMDQGDIASFKSTLHSLDKDYSDIKSVIDAKKRETLFDKPYVVGNIVLGNGYDNTANNNDWTADIRGYSAPFADDQLRGFARYRGLGSAPTINTNQNGVGAGLQATGINKSGEIEVGDKAYARAEGKYEFSDYFSAKASFEKNVFYLPPKAVIAGVTGNMSNVVFNWHQDEGLNAFAGYRYFNLTGNEKSEAYAMVTKRLLTSYDKRLSVSGWVQNQKNTNPNVAYFAPANQLEGSATLTYEFLHGRDLETKKYSLWHKVWVTYGVVSQYSYSTLPMFAYGYGQEISLGDPYSFRWGVGRTTFPFDGVLSSYYTGYIGFTGHF